VIITQPQDNVYAVPSLLVFVVLEDNLLIYIYIYIYIERERERERKREREEDVTFI